MNNHAINILEHILDKVGSIFSTSYGCLAGILLSLLAFLGDEQMSFYAVLGAVVFDAVLGSIRSIRDGRFFLSYLLRESFFKLLIYLAVLVLILTAERGMNGSWGIGTRMVCVLAFACELWSSLAHILILKPNFPFIRVMRSALSGEIASKLKTDKKNIEKLMSDEKD